MWSLSLRWGNGETFTHKECLPIVTLQRSIFLCRPPRKIFYDVFKHIYWTKRRFIVLGWLASFDKLVVGWFLWAAQDFFFPKQVRNQWSANGGGQQQKSWVWFSHFSLGQAATCFSLSVIHRFFLFCLLFPCVFSPTCKFLVFLQVWKMKRDGERQHAELLKKAFLNQL